LSSILNLKKNNKIKYFSMRIFIHIVIYNEILIFDDAEFTKYSFYFNFIISQASSHLNIMLLLHYDFKHLLCLM